MSENGANRQTIAILVGGGPAPGINGVIASATIEAVNRGFRVIGLLDGYRWLATGDDAHVDHELGIPRRQPDSKHRSGRFLELLAPTPRPHPRCWSRRSRRARQTRWRPLSNLDCGANDTTFGAAKIALSLRPGTDRGGDGAQDHRQRSPAAGKCADLRL